LRRDRRLAARNRYFAYGSNLHPGRLVERLEQVRLLSSAHLGDYRLVFHKQGRDGSGKCDIVPARGARVLGALYEISRDALLKLDRIEGRGYRRVRVRVAAGPAGTEHDAWTYRARPVARVAGAQPMTWYRDLVLAGAQYHQLPKEYIAELANIAARRDTHFLRNRYARSLPQRRLRRTGIRGIVTSVTCGRH